MDRFSQNGFALYSQIFCQERVSQMLASIPPLDGSAGTRNLLANPTFAELARCSELKGILSKLLPGKPRCVRGILFDKNPEANWVLGFHQDTKIAVRERSDVSGYSAWSEKEGVPHCLPPERILRNMVALRIALDDATSENGALNCIPGTHRLGLLKADEVAQHCGEEGVVCSCKAGDVVAMHPLTLHASSKSVSPHHRRVIHFEYCSEPLDPPLEWAF